MRIFIIVYGLFRIEITANQLSREKGERRKTHNNVGCKNNKTPRTDGTGCFFG